MESSDHLTKLEELGNGCHGSLSDGKTSPKAESETKIFQCSIDGTATSGTSVIKPRDLQEQSERVSRKMNWILRVVQDLL